MLIPVCVLQATDRLSQLGGLLLVVLQVYSMDVTSQQSFCLLR
jgi:hypothetical protein